MAMQPGVWGIDLGQCALKALRVENIEGEITATAFDYVEHPKILSQPDADPDQLIREALEKFLSRNALRGDLVAISIPGQSGLARFVKLPPVEEKKINDIVRFEAKQQIPFNLDEVVWDYQKLGAGAVTDGFAMETEIGLFAIKRDTVTRYLQHFKDVNVEVHVVQMAPLALCNFVSYDLLEKMEAPAADEENAGKKRCIVALDIGADNSNLVITDGQKIIWQRPIPLGGNHFTRVLTKDMKLTFAKAEHVKRNATKSPDLKQILSSLKPVLNDFVGEVQRSLGYFTNTHRDAYVQYMVGLGNAFRLPGLQKFLSEKLQIEVRKLQKLERLSGDSIITAPSYTENVLSFGVAYGLAIQGLDLARLHTNLLPQDIQVERLVRAKKPWAVIAAASLLLGTSVVAWGYNMQHRAVASEPVKKEMEKGKAAKSRADGFEAKVNEVKQKIDLDSKAVKSIVLGQDERMNWIQFNQFVNSALPKPDGSNLSTLPPKPGDPSAKQMFWNLRAKEAYEYLVNDLRGTGKSTEKVDEEKWRKYLVQANVESVDCRYCRNFPAFLTQMKNSMDRELLNEMSANLKDPLKDTDKGWVVALSGYTYHEKESEFVVKAVVDNLARLPIKEVPGQPTDGSTAAAPGATQGTPPAPSPPSNPPAPVNETGAANGSEAAKPKEPEHPIWNKVSHVVLYAYQVDYDPDPTKFSLIGGRPLDALAGGGSGGGFMAAKGGAMAAPGLSTGSGGGAGREGEGGPSATGGGAASFASWSPLTGGAGPSGGGFGGSPAVSMGGGKRGGASMGAGTAEGGVPAPGAREGAPPSVEQSNKRKGATVRTEFIVLFVWREPTPSDDLLPPEEAAPAASPMMGGGEGGPGRGN